MWSTVWMNKREAADLSWKIAINRNLYFLWFYPFLAVQNSFISFWWPWPFSNFVRSPCGCFDVLSKWYEREKLKVRSEKNIHSDCLHIFHYFLLFAFGRRCKNGDWSKLLLSHFSPQFIPHLLSLSKVYLQILIKTYEIIKYSVVTKHFMVAEVNDSND